MRLLGAVPDPIAWSVQKFTSWNAGGLNSVAEPLVELHRTFADPAVVALGFLRCPCCIGSSSLLGIRMKTVMSPTLRFRALQGIWEIPERWTTVVFKGDRIVFLEPDDRGSLTCSSDTSGHWEGHVLGFRAKGSVPGLDFN